MNAKEKNIVEIDLNAIVAHLSDTIAFTGQILKELPPSDKASSVGAVIRSDIESLIDILTVGSIGGEDLPQSRLCPTAVAVRPRRHTWRHGRNN
ncbi:hypothetical protein [Neisseria mucosa]|uniref:hypothetical protein n=1 Tax=Neisseria mucosa TaxID=488 RepID=UPI0018787855|nr:hypothetical protein [Neisseria mucosa]